MVNSNAASGSHAAGQGKTEDNDNSELVGGALNTADALGQMAPPAPNDFGGNDPLDDFLKSIARKVATIAVGAILLIAFANVTDIVARNIFHNSLYGLNEINTLLVAIAVSTCLPYGLYSGAALTITMLKERMSSSMAQLLDTIAPLMTCVFFGLLAWRVGAVAINQIDTNQTTLMTNISTGPFFLGMAIALGLAAALQAVLFARRFINVLQSGSPKTKGGAVLAIALMAWIVLALLRVVPSSPFEVLAPENRLVLALVVFVGMWVLVAFAIPIGVAMGLAGLVGTAAILGSKNAIEILGAEAAGFVTRDALSVLPLFLLMGAFATVAGIGSDLYRFANALIGHVRGGLAHASILACAAFGTLTGSSVATQLSIGRIALSEMRERKYSTELAAGSIAAGGTLGQLIPPSSALILYAVMTEQSVGQLFIGAVIPGILATCLYMSAVAVWLLIAPAHANPGARASSRELMAAARGAISVIGLLGTVLGGIYMGFFTELEAGAVGAAGAFLIAVSRGKINRQTFWKTLAGTTGTLAMMYSLIFGVTILTYFFGISGLPAAFIEFVNGFNLTPMGVVIALVICYLVLGTAMDAFAMMVITIPIFVPLVTSLGFDPIWWGLMTIVCMEAGMISPPFGLNIFVISSLDPKIPITTVYKGCWPFFMSSVIKIILLLMFPALVTWLPATM